jgi:hypothetical protein
MAAKEAARLPRRYPRHDRDVNRGWGAKHTVGDNGGGTSVLQRRGGGGFAERDPEARPLQRWRCPCVLLLGRYPWALAHERQS